MTTPLIPDFILKLFQDEIRKVTSLMLEKFCQVFEIDLDEAKARLKNELNIELELTANPYIKIIKKQKQLEPSERCIANVFHKERLELCQCSRRKLFDDSKMCKRHHRMWADDRLQHGTIEDEKEGDVKKKVLKLKKYVIY